MLGHAHDHQMQLLARRIDTFLFKFGIGIAVDFVTLSLVLIHWFDSFDSLVDSLV